MAHLIWLYCGGILFAVVFFWFFKFAAHYFGTSDQQKTFEDFPSPLIVLAVFLWPLMALVLIIFTFWPPTDDELDDLD